MLVAEHGFERVEIGIGARHEDAVELLLLFDLGGIDREVLVADRLEITPVAGVDHQRLVARTRPVKVAFAKLYDRKTPITAADS